MGDNDLAGRDRDNGRITDRDWRRWQRLYRVEIVTELVNSDRVEISDRVDE